MRVTQTITVSVPVTKTTSHQDGDGNVVTETTTEMQTEQRQVEVDVPDPKLAEPDAAQQRQSAIQDAQQQAQQDAQPKPISADDAKQEMTSIQDGLKSAKTSAEVNDLANRANTLATRAGLSTDPGYSADTRSQIQQLQSSTQTANQALNRLEYVAGNLGKGEAEAAATTASLLTHPDSIKSTLRDLGALKDSPVMAQVQKDVQVVSDKANTDELAKQLSTQPDLSAYPPGTVKNLAALRGLNDPQLQAALDKVATNALNKGISLKDMRSQPELGKLLAPLANGSDPAIKQKLNDTVKGWEGEAIKEHLKDKNHHSVNKGLDEFRDEMVDLAKTTGLGPVLQSQVQNAMNDCKKDIQHTANKDKGFWDEVGDAFGGALKIGEDYLGAIGKGADFALSGVGTILGKALDLAGDGLGYVWKAEGAVAKFGIDAVGNLASAGLDAVGAHGLAQDVKKTSHLLGDAVEQADDAVGEGIHQFGAGAGAAIEGMGKGLGFIAAHPIQTVEAFGAMAQHPELIAAAGQKMWNDATKGGAAYAAGYIAGSLLPMVLTAGGGSAAEGAALAGDVAEAAEAANAVSKVAEVAEVASEVSGQAGAKLATEGLAESASSATGGALKGLGDVLKNAGTDFLKGKAENLQSNLKNLKDLATTDVRSQISNKVEGLKNFVEDAKNFNAKDFVSGKVSDLKSYGNDIVGHAKDLKAEGLNDLKGIVGDVKKFDFASAAEKFEVSTLKAAKEDLQALVKFGSNTFKLVTDPFGFGTKKAFKAIGGDSAFRQIAVKQGTNMLAMAEGANI